MGESNQYRALNLEQVERTLSGESPDASKVVERLIARMKIPLVRRLIRDMQAGYPLRWDSDVLADEPWETFAELSAYIASVVRLFGTEVGFDAWPDRLRVSMGLHDWSPLSRDFGRQLLCRPLRPIVFEHLEDVHPVRWSLYAESYPHGFIRREEFGDILPGLHTMLTNLQRSRSGGDEGPLAHLPPGRGVPPEDWVDLQAEEDAETGWLFARALHLYNAICASAERGMDLAIIGY